MSVRDHHLRDVLYSVFVLESRPHVVRKLTRHLDGVHARNVAVESLVLCYPRARRVGEGDDTLKDLRGAAFDLVLGASEVEELVAVRAAFVAESLENKASALWNGMDDGWRETHVVGHDDGADHTRAQVALLAGGDEIRRCHDSEIASRLVREVWELTRAMLIVESVVCQRSRLTLIATARGGSCKS